MEKTKKTVLTEEQQKSLQNRLMAAKRSLLEKRREEYRKERQQRAIYEAAQDVASLVTPQNIRESELLSELEKATKGRKEKTTVKTTLRAKSNSKRRAPNGRKMSRKEVKEMNRIKQLQNKRLAGKG